MLSYNKIIASELGVREQQVEATVGLLDEGATIPFISRYRKEVTGTLDEVQVATIRDRITQLRELDKRREAILKSLEEMGKLSDELKEKINAADSLTVLEDLYLPYRPKRKTKASVAKEKGLEPLALDIFEQENKSPIELAEKFIDAEKGVNTIEEALQGARDIIAEKISEDAEARAKVREIFLTKGLFRSKVIKGKEEEGIKYKDYYEWSESVKDAPSHRILALRRGEKELFLSLEISPDEEETIEILNRMFLKSKNACADEVALAIKDGYKRLLAASIETETRVFTKAKADEEAIKVFAENARQLLLSAPLGQKRTLAIDPGFRTGCKVVCLDEQGKLLENTTIYPHEPQKKLLEAQAIIKQLVDKYNIESIAIGNGTAGRETEAIIRAMNLPNVLVVMVNESGASIYSASDVAREEFPDYDITVRGAVSIGRRLMDPLAELVKIDPKSIGVGQYQHDVDQNKLQKSLDDVVSSSVNAVGVELNTASKQLLSYVSGLGPVLAQNIIEFRNANGAFKSRSELKKVARLGDKAFEQAAGFLRIRGAANPLDASAVHPERYSLVEQMAKDLKCSLTDLMSSDELRKKLDLNKYVSDEVGLPTLKDIMSELSKPGRDPREQFEIIQFTDGVNSIEDLRIGMQLTGIVTNLTKFGAFVDIGVHQDGLVHVSHISNTFIDDPAKVLKVQQKVKVSVLEVDVARKRISLSMKTESAPKPKSQQKKEGQPQKSDEQSMKEKLAMLASKFGK
ncbi:MAG: Tex family protein [bacterium]